MIEVEIRQVMGVIALMVLEIEPEEGLKLVGLIVQV